MKQFLYLHLVLILVVITVVSIAGFRGQHFSKTPMEIFPDMNYQDKVKDQQPSAFFADGNSARAPIPGTVAEEMVMRRKPPIRPPRPPAKVKRPTNDLRRPIALSRPWI